MINYNYGTAESIKQTFDHYKVLTALNKMQIMSEVAYDNCKGWKPFSLNIHVFY